MAVCSQIHTKHVNTLRGQNEELLNVNLLYIWLPGCVHWNNVRRICAI